MTDLDLKWPVLVLLTGPVGGGKSTTAIALAAHLRASGHSTGVIDLDLLYPMAQQDEPRYSDTETWKIVHRSAAVLAEVFFASGIGVVIVEGGFFNAGERSWLCDYLTTKPAIKYVTLDVSWEEACRRVDADPSVDRVATRNREVLRWHHDQFAKGLPFLRETSVVIEADAATPSGLALRVAAVILATHE